MSATWPALLAAWLSGASPGIELPAYPGVELTRVGSRLHVGGAPFRMAYFVTADPPSAVARYFLSLWGRRGLPTSAVGSFRSQGCVSAFLTREGAQLSVVVQRRGGATLGFAVVGDLDAWLGGGRLPAGGPMMGTAR